MSATSNLPLLETIASISTIPTLPTVIDRISNLLKNPQTSADEVGKAITTDQALASKVLKLVNSAFYGFPGKISTITHAVVILGFSTIKNIVLTASILKAFKKANSDIPLFNMEKFWHHSIACGAAAQTIARHLKIKEKEECFIAGLIHDIGKIVLCQYLPLQFQQIIMHAHENNTLIFESEQTLFNATHQEVGGMLAKNWNLPPSLQAAICFHHNPPPNHPSFPIICSIHTADILVRALDLGNGGDNKIPCMSQQVWNFLNFDKQALGNLLIDIEQEVERATIFMQI